jgi:hypothetical protein
MPPSGVGLSLRYILKDFPIFTTDEGIQSDSQDSVTMVMSELFNSMTLASSSTLFVT